MTVNHGTTLADQVREACGENVFACFQCKKCTAGCPVADRFDLTPHRMLRAMQLGQKEMVLRSRTLWLCASCEACYTRCPQAVNFPRIIDALRIIAAREGVAPSIRPVPAFYTAALRGIKLFGRMYEAGLMGELYLRMLLSGDLDRQQLFREDVPLAIRMLKNGKLKLLPPLSRAAKHAHKATAATARVKVGYYPGCSLHSTGVEYDLSIRAIADKIGLELVEPDGWVCCGTTPAHSTDHLMATVMPMKSLRQVEKSGQTCVTVPCPSCFVRLRTAMKDVAADPALKEKVQAQAGYTPSPELRVDHLLTTITEKVGIEAVSAAVTRPLRGLKVVCYYGCVITRPPDVTGATEYEYPTGMDRILRALGAEVLDWSNKTECCGGSLAISQLPVALGLTGKVLEDAKQVGAEAVVVACPLCQTNLDTRERQIAKQTGRSYEMPILYFTQLMGLAFGLEPKALGIDMHTVAAVPLLRERGILQTPQAAGARP